jgi:hypothetical protein
MRIFLQCSGEKKWQSSYVFSNFGMVGDLSSQLPFMQLMAGGWLARLRLTAI